MKKTIIRVADLRDQVYEGLRLRIVGGELRPGDKLTEVHVAQEFGVSRTPAREALVMLTQSGLVQSVGRSFELPLFKQEDIREIFDIRRLLEPHGVRSIIKDTPDPQLKNACNKMRRLIQSERTFKGYVRAHTAFRQVLFDLLGNDRLRKLITTFDEQVQFIRLMTLVDDEARETSITGNLKLIADIEARQADASASSMMALIDRSEQVAIRRLKGD